MDPLSWSSKYEINNPMLDQQHRQLFLSVNKLGETLANPRDITAFDSEVGTFMMELVAYVKMHFSTEERLMRESNFPQLTNHIKHHRLLEYHVNQFSSKLGQTVHETEKLELTKELYLFTKAWLTSHILIMDVDIGQHLLSLNDHQTP